MTIMGSVGPHVARGMTIMGNDDEPTSTICTGSGAASATSFGRGTHVASGVMPIHPSIVSAICKIQMSLEAVKKSQPNLHGGYKFASTDDIYAATTKKLGEVGLMILCREDACEIVRLEKEGKTVQWLKITFSFVLATTEATWSDPGSRRTLYIQVTGPQTFQASQSYAEKAYLRSLFKIPTGDMDLDAMPEAESEEDQVSLIQPQKRKSSAEGKRDGSVKKFNELRAAIAQAANADQLRFIRSEHAEQWATLPPAWVETLDGDYEVKMDSFNVHA